MFVTINGIGHYIWRTVDQDGVALDMLVTHHRNRHAARRVLRRLMRGEEHTPRVLITDKLRSYGAAHRELMPSVEQRQSRYLNNRAENSHQRTRLR